jgi:hypothetical protein
VEHAIDAPAARVDVVDQRTEGLGAADIERVILDGRPCRPAGLDGRPHAPGLLDAPHVALDIRRQNRARRAQALDQRRTQGSLVVDSAQVLRLGVGIAKRRAADEHEVGPSLLSQALDHLGRDPVRATGGQHHRVPVQGQSAAADTAAERRRPVNELESPTALAVEAHLNGGIVG